MNDLFEGLFELPEDVYTDPAFESIATNLRRDYQEDPEEPISLKSMYCVHMNNDALEKYQEEYDQLKKVDKNAEKLRGCMYFWQKELAAFISIDIRSDKVWIDTLEVVKNFRGKKLSFQLLDVAVRKFHATDLKVHIDNKKAIGIFKTYGFKTYDKKNKWLYMTLRDDVKDIDEKHTEDVKPVDKGTKTDDIQEAKESAAMEGFFDLFKKKEKSPNRKDYVEFVEAHVVTDAEKDELIEVAKICINSVNKNISKVVSKHGVEKMRSAFKPKMDTSALDSGYIPFIYINFWDFYPNLRYDISNNGTVPLMNAFSDLMNEVKSVIAKSKYTGYTVDNGGDWDEWTMAIWRTDCLPDWDRPANESAVFNKSKDSTEVEKLLTHTEPTLRRQLTTIEDCDKYLEVIKNESTKFNEAANAIISAYSKYESGDKTKEDTKEFNKTVAAGKKLLNDNCRKLNVRLGKLVGDNDHISRQDIKNFAQYISGLRKIVNSIKRDLSKKKQ